MRALKVLSLLFLLYISPACKRKKRTYTSPTNTEIPVYKPQNITVFVHGTLPPDFIYQIPFLHDFFYCPQGLSLVHDMDKKYTLSNFQLMTEQNPEQFNKQTFYFFGWSGDLNYDARYKAAQDLYHALLDLSKKHPGLPLRVITQSHGGNVALNLARIAQEHDDQELSIETLVLIACPVQEVTASYVHASLFNTIYVLYSPVDLIQVADPQGFYEETRKNIKHGQRRLFSHRHFPKDEKLTHCRLRLNGRGMGHSDFLGKPFLKNLPTIIQSLEVPTKRTTLKKVRKMDEYIIRIFG